MSEKEYDEYYEEFKRHKKMQELALERQINKTFELMEELSERQNTEYNVGEMLKYEKLIFDYLAEEYYGMTVTKKCLLSNLSKAGNNLTDNNATAILPSKLKLDSFGENNGNPNEDKRNEIEKFIVNTNLEELGIKVFPNDDPSRIRFMDVLIFSLFYIQ